jgi:hypothetical protein
MASTDGFTIEELTYDHETGGTRVREQVAKEIVASGPVWATVAFLHRSLDIAKGGWKPLQITVSRFKRVAGAWKKQSSFNINGIPQLDRLMEVLGKFRALMR